MDICRCQQSDMNYPQKLKSIKNCPDELFYLGNIELFNSQPCVAVLPRGLDEIYPRSNKNLAQSILKNGGCLISEYKPGTRPTRYSFVHRDRIQSGISYGLIVVETEESGGTMHTVEFAKQHNRLLACYYSAVGQVASGNRMIVDKGIGSPIDDETSMMDFLMKVKESDPRRYEQLTIFDLK